ncbi:MAG: RNA polymerase sigma factor [Planctomycetes bacterium]|nr:RNA polymerase sigma factor [Planctomycetota bacterium]
MGYQTTKEEIEHLREGVGRGDHDAFRELYNLLAEPLARFAWQIVRDRDVASDLVQTAFMQIFEKRNRVSEHLRGYAFSVVGNLARNHLRSQAMHRKWESENSSERDSSDLNTLALASQAWEALLMLPVEEQEPLLLRFDHGLGVKEVAVALDCPQGTAATRIRRGLDRLRTKLSSNAQFGVLPVSMLPDLLSQGSPLVSPSIKIPSWTGMEAALMASAKKISSLVLSSLILLLLSAGIGVATLVITEDSHPDFSASLSPNTPSLEVDPGMPSLKPTGASKRPETAQPNASVMPPDDSGATDTVASSTTVKKAEWKIRGRVVLSQSLQALPESFLRPDLPQKILIYFLSRNSRVDKPELKQFQADLDPDGSFDVASSDDELDIEEGRDGPDGYWQVLYTWEEESELITLKDVRGGVDIGTVPFLHTPVVRGKAIDFGTITIDFAQLFHEKIVLTGRLVHTSGVPLSFLSECLLLHRGSDYEAVNGRFGTDEKGRFACFFDHGKETESYSALDAAALRWVLSAGTPYGAGNDDNHDRRIDRPVVTGNILDFGEIQLAGALLEITAEIEPDVETESEVYVELKCAGYPARVAVPLKPKVTRLTVPFGQCNYEASTEWDGDGFIHATPQRGVMNIVEGHIHRLELKFTRDTEIDVELVPDEGRLFSPDINWYLIMDKTGEQVGSGITYYHRTGRVPVREGCTTRVKIRATGYEDVDTSATAETEKLVVPLKRLVSTCELEVVVPLEPEGGIDFGWVKLILDWELGSKEESIELGRSRVTLRIQFDEPHDVTVTLRELDEVLGYPGGILCGPIRVKLKAGETISVELPAIAPPPWPRAAEYLQTSLVCGGKLISLRGNVGLNAVGERIKFTFDNQTRSFLEVWPTAIADGDQSISLDVTPPSADSPLLHLQAAVDSRLELRCSRTGQKIKDFRAELEHIGGEDALCEASTIDGTLNLWLPAGRAELRIYVNDDLVDTREVEIVRATNQLVEVPLNLVRVVITGGDAVSFEDAYPDWLLELQGESGNYLPQDWIYGGATLFLAPGKYRIVPVLGQNAETIEFDISDGKDTEIKLPKVPKVERGDVILQLDSAQFGEALVDADLYWAPANIYQKRRMLPVFDDEWGMYSVRSSITPEGLRLFDLPLNTDIVIFGNIHAKNLEGKIETVRVLKPLRRSLSQPLQSVTSSWLTTSKLGEEWLKLHPDCASLMDGFAFGFNYLGYAPVGRHEVAFYRDGEVVVRAWVTVPSSAGPFKIPPELRKALMEKGVLESDGE